MTRREAGGADEGDDDAEVDSGVEGVADGVFREVAVVGPEGAVVDKEVDAVAVGF
jgi:hypothetical protein